MRVILFLLVSIVLSACAGTGQSLEQQTLKALDQHLSRNAHVAVQIPQNGRYQDIIYQGSGQKTAAAFQIEFDRYAASTKLIGDCQKIACIEDAGQAGADYFVALEIVHWEERQTAWSGKRDRITVKVAVFDVANGAELTSAYLQANSTMNTMGGDHVDDLLPAMIPPYVSSLF